MDQLEIVTECLQAARDNHEQEYNAQLKKLDDKQNCLTERLKELNEKKRELANANGNEDATGDDLVEVNAGGKVIAARRSALTQLAGARMEALFSGRWDKKLQRDSEGRIFLDVNPLCFQAIVDYLNELTISSKGNPPALPTIDAEHKSILKHQLELFGLLKEDPVPAVKMPETNIIKDESHIVQLHDWLKESGSDGAFSLLYRSSRDGPSPSSFHSRCDNRGCTLIVIQTTDGFVVGGYSNVPWANSGTYSGAKRAFLFGISGSGIGAPFKMTLKNGSNKSCAVHHTSSYGPTFGGGHDLVVNGSSHICSNLGYTYEQHSSWPLRNGQVYNIKEMEVFQVVPGATVNSTPKEKAKPSPRKSKFNKVDKFSKEVNAAMNGKWMALQEAEEELLALEDSFKDEGAFISFFVAGRSKDVATLNVCGTIMATRLQNLQLWEGSSLASKFSSEEREEQTPGRKAIKDWNHEDVIALLNKLDGIPESIVKEFEGDQVTGRELLALGPEGLREFGVTRRGTIYLLLDEIKKLEKAETRSSILIEHSPYCFEKILDHLRLESSFVKGLVITKYAPPVVRQSEKERYQKVLNHLFPGESSKIFENV